MNRIAICLLVLLLATSHACRAGTIVRIADGDCAALSAAAAAAPGDEPSLIVLARNGHYAACPLHVTGIVSIDGAGAAVGLTEVVSFNATAASQITLTQAARLMLRNVNFVYPVATSGAAAAQPKFIQISSPAITNAGTMVLESVSMYREGFGTGGGAPATINGGFLVNSGSLILRNVSIVDTNSYNGPLLNGNVEISHSTIVTRSASGSSLLGAGTFTLANSLISSGHMVCFITPETPTQIVSHGGNVVSDDSCGALDGEHDRTGIADARFLDFAMHGGVVGTLALNYDSPAIGNGVAANCEAADARGQARGTNACDSGAYEVGGGNGKLGATGMSGLYFNAANNGHYVSIQRLYGDQALVIWNTFDEHGVPAWLYGVGTVGGNNAISVAQVAQNVGGTLHDGGGVSGATPTLWGTFDVVLSDCYSATLNYSSPLPQFGTGRTTLRRLAFLDGVNCAQ